MRQWILNIAIIAVIVAVADWATGAAGNAMLRHMPDTGTFEADINQALTRKSADVLILGSSKAKHHYVPRVLEDSLGMSVYNAGADGHDVAYACLVLQSWLTRCTPRVVVLDICNSMVNGDWIDNSIADIKCYYGQNKAVTAYIDSSRDWRLKLKLHSNLYRLNGSLVWLTKAMLKHPAATTDGYSPLYGSDIEHGNTTYGPFTPSHVEAEQLRRIAWLCRRNGIRLHVVLSPNHEIDNGMRHWLAAETKRDSVAFADMTEAPEVWADRYYKDRGHLNNDGAVMFTSMITTMLRQDLAASQISKCEAK